MPNKVNGLVYLAFGGVEVSNAERTRRYLELGLGPANIDVIASASCAAIVAVEQGGVNAVSPSVDPAPWYSAAVPESAGFLGFVVDDVDGLDVTVNLSVQDRLRVGAALGTTLREARVLRIRGYLLATSCASLEYGRAWLAKTLTATCDVSCGGTTVRMRRLCPPGGYPNTWGVQTGYGAALLEAPKVLSTPDGCCDYAEVDFAIVLTNPDLFDDAVSALASTPLQASLGASCIDFCSWLTGQPAAASVVVTAPPTGAAAAVVTVTTGASPVNGAAVGVWYSLYPAAALFPADCLYPSSILSAPEPLPQECPAIFYFDQIPANTTLVIDGAQRAVYTLQGGEQVDASNLLLVADGYAPAWPVVDCGAVAGVAAAAAAYCSGGDDATVTIQTRTRE